MKKIRKFAAVALVAARSKMAYCHELWARGLFFGIILFTFTQLWLALLGRDGSLAGFYGRDLVWYLAITEVIVLSQTTLLRQVETDVKSGQIAYLLLRPANYVLYQAANYFGEVAVAMLMNLVVGSLVATLLVGPPPTNWVNAGLTLIALIAGMAVQFCFLISIGLLSFYVEECRPFYWIYQKLIFTLGGLFVPLDIYPDFIRRISSALPFQAVTYAPARVFLKGSGQFFDLLLTAALWILALSLIICWEYKQGVKCIHANGG